MRPDLAGSMVGRNGCRAVLVPRLPKQHHRQVAENCRNDGVTARGRQQGQTICRLLSRVLGLPRPGGPPSVDASPRPPSVHVLSSLSASRFPTCTRTPSHWGWPTV